jgi:hypothetical protein
MSKIIASSAALASAFAAIDSSVAEIDSASQDRAKQENRKTARTMDDVEEEFPGIAMFLQNLRKHALTASGLMTEEGLATGGLSDQQRWDRYNGMYVVEKDANGVVVRRENGKPSMKFRPGIRPVVFGMFRAAMSKEVVKNADGSTRPIYKGTFSLPGFNDGSADAPHGNKKFTRTELGAIIKQFGMDWDNHPVTEPVATFGRKLDETRRERQADSINRNASRHHSNVANPQDLASDRDVANYRRQAQGASVGTNLGAKLDGVLDKLLASKEPTVVQVTEAPAAEGASPEALAEVEAMNAAASEKPSRRQRAAGRKTKKGASDSAE